MKKSLILLLVLALGLGTVTPLAFAQEEEITGEISVFHYTMGAEMQSRKQMSELFMKKYPGVKVTTNALPAGEYDTKLDAYLAAGNAPDVIMMSPDWYGIRSKYFEDLTPWVETSQTVRPDFYLDGVYEKYILPDGKMEAVPLSANSVVLLYNKKLFDEAGVAYPTQDWTWDDFREICVKLSRGEGMGRIYGCINDAWILSWVPPSMYGGCVFDAQRKNINLLDAKSMEGFELMRYLIQDAKAIPDAGVSKTMPSQQMFLAGLAAMYIMPGWEATGIGEKIGDNFDWDMATMPNTPDGANTNFVFLTGYAMYNESKNKEAAWKYMEFVSTDPECAKLWAQYAVPCGKEMANGYYANMTLPNSDVSAKGLMEGALNAQMYPLGGVVGQAVVTDYNLAYERITLNNQAVKETFETAVPTLQEALDRVNQRY